MSENLKIVVVAEKTNVSAQGEFANQRRTAVFNENTTLKEVLDWARKRNDTLALFDSWDSARITLSEDEITHPKKSLHGLFSTDEKKGEPSEGDIPF